MTEYAVWSVIMREHGAEYTGVRLWQNLEYDYGRVQNIEYDYGIVWSMIMAED